MMSSRAAEVYVRKKWFHGTVRGRVICRYGNRALKLILKGMGRETFQCPICSYSGPLFTMVTSATRRINAMCPGCGGLERHRLQWLVLNRIPERAEFRRMRMLHVAPEPFFSRLFRPMFREYVTTDLEGRGVDIQADITNLPMLDNSFDIVYASHVLEHIKNDRQAVAEIRRVLAPGGLAILPVPVFMGVKTVEYPQANPAETYHVRQPGSDYYDRYTEYFPCVKRYSSDDFDAKNQVFIFEDRSQWPTPQMPLRQPMPGLKHRDVVPVCYRQ